MLRNNLETYVCTTFIPGVDSIPNKNFPDLASKLDILLKFLFYCFKAYSGIVFQFFLF